MNNVATWQEKSIDEQSQSESLVRHNRTMKYWTVRLKGSYVPYFCVWNVSTLLIVRLNCVENTLNEALRNFASSKVHPQNKSKVHKISLNKILITTK